MPFLDEFSVIRIDKSKSLRENILRWVEECIFSGYFPPGLRLIESELAEHLKISRTPIREAILQLETKGLVKVIPNKGAVVMTYSIAEIEEIHIIFKVLSGIVASLSVEFISEDELRQMEDRIAKMERSKDDNNIDRREWFILNNEFHSILLKPCKKRLLLGLINSYSKQIGRYWYLHSHTACMELFNQEHRGILETLKLGDSRLVREKVENHVESFSNIVIKTLMSFTPIEIDYSNYFKEGTVFLHHLPVSYAHPDKRKVKK
jgi:DNA-binding GntR family transcriptional regulator